MGSPTAAPENGLDRRRAVAHLLEQLPDALVVSGLGSPTYDVYAAGGRASNFYLWGAMGGAVPMSLGLALAQPDRSVLAVTGDGEQLMGLGSLATVAASSPANLTVVVLDNGHFGETGMQASHTSLGADLAEVADRSATTFARVVIAQRATPRALPPRDGVANKNGFRAALGLETF